MSGRRLPPAHPGRFLRNEFLKPLDLSVYALARALRVPRPRLNDVTLGRRFVSTDTALRLARYFGTSPAFWVNLQARYDFDVAERKLRCTIDGEVKPRGEEARDRLGAHRRNATPARAPRQPASPRRPATPASMSPARHRSKNDQIETIGDTAGSPRPDVPPRAAAGLGGPRLTAPSR